MQPARPSRSLSDIEKRLLNDFQQGFPLSERPFAELGAQLGLDEDQVLTALQRLQAEGYITRVGAVFRPNRVGASTLAALAVPDGRLSEVADLVSAYPEVNHNYEREHEFNLWFVVTAADRARLRQVLENIQAGSGLKVLDLPLEEDYFINLGFPLQWT
jgi:DNA-binding Lrp family transcriptional regulator